MSESGGENYLKLIAKKCIYFHSLFISRLWTLLESHLWHQNRKLLWVDIAYRSGHGNGYSWTVSGQAMYESPSFTP